MGRPIKITKGPTIDTAYSNMLGLGVVGGDSSIAGSQVGCKINVDGTVRDGYIVRQKGSRKFYVSSLDNLYRGTCVLQNSATPTYGGMSVSITTATAGVKYLAKFNDVLGETFEGQLFYLTMKAGGQSAQAPAGMQFQIAAIQTA